MNWIAEMQEDSANDWSGASKRYEEFIRALSSIDVLIADGTEAWIGISSKDDDYTLKPLQLNDVGSRNSELDKMFDEFGGALYE